MSYNRETGLYEGFIYKIKNDVNDYLYIGRTYKTIHSRWRDHKRDSKKKSTKLYNAMNMYGEDHFCIECIEYLYANTKDEINDLCIVKEKEWIKYFKENEYNLYNMTSGGEDFDALNNLKKPVILYNLFCEEIAKYPSIQDASDATGIDCSSISSCCLRKGDIYSTKNYIWRYVESPLCNEEIEQLHKRYPGICQYDYQGNLINVYYRPKDVHTFFKSKNIFNIKESNIEACAKGRKKSAYGYVWRYRKDSFNKYPFPEKTGRVEQHSLTGELINIYKNCVDAEKKTGISKNSIRLCCAKKCKTGGDYIWCYEGDSFSIEIPVTKKPVDRYDLNFNYIDSFESMADAERKTGIDSGTIGFLCNNDKRYKTAGGYIWRFSGEDISTYLYFENKNELKCVS